MGWKLYESDDWNPNKDKSNESKNSDESEQKKRKFHGLDQIAQKLVLDAKDRDADSLNQGYKMRMATAYGLERFWGEHLRLQRREQQKAQYWKDTWNALVGVMQSAGHIIPNDDINPDDTSSVRKMSQALWDLDMETQRVALAVLTQLCDCIVWWTQRHK